MPTPLATAPDCGWADLQGGHVHRTLCLRDWPPSRLGPRAPKPGQGISADASTNLCGRQSIGPSAELLQPAQTLIIVFPFWRNWKTSFAT